MSRTPTLDEHRLTTVMAAFRQALREAGLPDVRPPTDDPFASLLEHARDSAERRALVALGTKRRTVLGRVVQYLDSGEDLATAKKRAADQCNTSMDAVNTLFSELRRKATNRRNSNDLRKES